ncbi:MAG: hypothetical protein Q8873_05500 [Bacillota bacterium]|nr:hypothetical protein [Bacillota bacterium]
MEYDALEPVIFVDVNLRGIRRKHLNNKSAFQPSVLPKRIIGTKIKIKGTVRK